MKKLTLNQINLEVIESVSSSAICDFCGEWVANMVKAAFPHKYLRLSKLNKKEIEQTFWPCICFNCIEQLSKLIAK